MSELPILSIITFIPVIGALVLLLMPKGSVGAIRNWTLLVSVVNFVVSLPLLAGFDASNGGMQFVEKANWIASLGVQYHLGIDGISLWLVILTTFPLKVRSP